MNAVIRWSLILGYFKCVGVAVVYRRNPLICSASAPTQYDKQNDNMSENSSSWLLVCHGKGHAKLANSTFRRSFPSFCPALFHHLGQSLPSGRRHTTTALLRRRSSFGYARILRSALCPTPLHSQSYSMAGFR